MGKLCDLFAPLLQAHSEDLRPIAPITTSSWKRCAAHLVHHYLFIETDVQPIRATEISS